MKTFVSLLAVFAAFVGLSAQASANSPRFVMAHVKNETIRPVALYVSWGTGDWQKIVLQRGDSKLLSQRLAPGQTTAPALRVRMDTDVRPEREQLMEHALTTASAPMPGVARSTKYVIRQFGNTPARQILKDGVGHVKITNKDVPVPHVGPL